MSTDNLQKAGQGFRDSDPDVGTYGVTGITLLNRKYMYSSRGGPTGRFQGVASKNRLKKKGTFLFFQKEKKRVPFLSSVYFLF